jgi:hypothetical protein
MSIGPSILMGLGSGSMFVAIHKLPPDSIVIGFLWCIGAGAFWYAGGYWYGYFMGKGKQKFNDSQGTTEHQPAQQNA